MSCSPSAMKCLTADREGLTAYLRFPAGHHHRIRHSNFIERTFGETRRRVKVIGRLPGETSCLTLVCAVLDQASRGWRGLTLTADGPRPLQDLRRLPARTAPPALANAVTTLSPVITRKLSQPSPNLTMKPEPPLRAPCASCRDLMAEFWSPVTACPAWRAPVSIVACTRACPRRTSGCPHMRGRRPAPSRWPGDGSRTASMLAFQGSASPPSCDTACRQVTPRVSWSLNAPSVRPASRGYPAAGSSAANRLVGTGVDARPGGCRAHDHKNSCGSSEEEPAAAARKSPTSSRFSGRPHESLQRGRQI
jgi:hypothetical protein